MTWSIVTHDPASGAFAVAVATCAFAVGASCPFVRAGVGAVSTQSMTNRYLGPAILDGLARGLDPAAAIEGALAGDAGSGLRQVHAVDRHGRTAAWTGRHCVEWCGSVAAARDAGGWNADTWNAGGRDVGARDAGAGDAGAQDNGAQNTGGGVSVAGNMLAGEAVIAATLTSFLADPPPEQAQELPERLMRAMLAGQAAGGDRRGRQSAAMRLVTTEDFPDLDLRVDDHPDPLGELGRLLALWRQQAAPRLALAPRRANPAGVTDLDAIEAGWRARGLDLCFRR